METQAKAPKIGFGQNFPNCKSNQKQVIGTKWGIVKIGLPPLKWGQSGYHPYKNIEVGNSGTVLVECLPPQMG